jgi:hypothetical protein
MKNCENHRQVCRKIARKYLHVMHRHSITYAIHATRWHNITCIPGNTGGVHMRLYIGLSKLNWTYSLSIHWHCLFMHTSYKSDTTRYQNDTTHYQGWYKSLSGVIQIIIRDDTTRYQGWYKSLSGMIQIVIVINTTSIAARNLTAATEAFDWSLSLVNTALYVQSNKLGRRAGSSLLAALWKTR